MITYYKNLYFSLLIIGNHQDGEVEQAIAVPVPDEEAQPHDNSVGMCNH